MQIITGITVTMQAKVLGTVCMFGIIFNGVLTCDLTGVTLCTNILGRNTNVSVMSEGLSAIPTVEQLNGLCGSLKEFKNCYQPKAVACSNDVIFSMTFGTVEKTIDYLCEEGFNDIVEYASCWNQSEVTMETTNCHVVQNAMITSLQQHSAQLNSTQMKDSWCYILDNTTACMRGAVERRCGSAPACIMHTMMSRALEGLAGLMKCPAPQTCVIPTKAVSTKVSASGRTNPTGNSTSRPDTTGDNAVTISDDVKFTDSDVTRSTDNKQRSQIDDMSLDNSASTLVLFNSYTFLVVIVSSVHHLLV